MTATGTLVRLEVQHTAEADVEEQFAAVVARVHERVPTSACVVVRFGRGSYGVVDLADDDTEMALGAGAAITAIAEAVGGVLESAPEILEFEVLAGKLPVDDVRPLTKGLLVTIEAKHEHEAELEAFLHEARDLVEDEPETVAWFAVRFEGGRYGIFDVFPDNDGRFGHLTGRVPRELAKHSVTLLGGVPDLDLLDVVAHELPRRPLPR